MFVCIYPFSIGSKIKALLRKPDTAIYHLLQGGNKKIAPIAKRFLSLFFCLKFFDLNLISPVK
jgi:hypothetical protein